MYVWRDGFPCRVRSEADRPLLISHPEFRIASRCQQTGRCLVVEAIAGADLRTPGWRCGFMPASVSIGWIRDCLVEARTRTVQGAQGWCLIGERVIWENIPRLRGV